MKRSCAGEMEREVAEIMAPLGLNAAICRRVAGELQKVETQFVPSQPSSTTSWFRSALSSIARSPRTKLSSSEDGGHREENLKVGSNDVGMTAFLLKFGEGLEDVPTSRLWISAVTIGGGYAIGGFVLASYHCLCADVDSW